MKLFGYSAIEYFNRWFVEPIRADDSSSIEAVIDALNHHPIAEDETANDYVMPPSRWREKPGRFRIFGENQDLWYCFVDEGQEKFADAPVYFESCLDLAIDHELPEEEIINGDHALVSLSFKAFLWCMLADLVCIRTEGNGLLSPKVRGVVFADPINVDDGFVNPIGREFAAGLTFVFKSDVICIPEWGAAFLNADSERRFMEQYNPDVWDRWE